MKKAELKKLKPLKASAQMIRVYEEDKAVEKEIRANYKTGARQQRVDTYRYYRFLRAAVENGILKVCIWQRYYLREKGQEPDYTIFIDRNEKKWITYGLKGWQTAKIFNLDYKRMQGEVFGSGNWCSRSELKIVTDYLGISASTIFEAVRKYQVSGSMSANTVYHKNELEEIDEFMESVQEYPKGFNNDWLIKTGFIDLTSIMYHPGKKVTKGLCTRCQKIVPIADKPKHLKETVCPSCRAKAKYRSWNKQKFLFARKTVGILQRTKSGEEYCLSQFHIQVMYKKENGYSEPEISRGAVERFRIDNDFIKTEAFEMNEYKNTGVVRWCHARQHGMGYSYYFARPDCIIYEKNLGTMFEKTNLRYTPVKELFEQVSGKQMDVIENLRIMNRYPEVFEKLAKAGLRKLAIELSNQYDYYLPDNVDKDGKRLNEVLKLDRERAKLAVEMNISKKELRILQLTQKAGIHPDAELIKDITRFYNARSDDDIVIILRRKNLRKTLGYLKKLQEQRDEQPWTVARDYDDYLEQLERLNMPLDKHNRFPANFYHVHEELSEQIRELEDKYKKADTRKKNRMLKKTLKIVEPLYNTESEDFIMVWPKNKKDFQTEGQLQHNCVGGYFDRCAQNQTTVFFVRKKEEPEKPFCTVEFTNGKLIQCRTAYNGAAPDDVEEYMKQIEEHYRKEKEQQLLKEA